MLAACVWAQHQAIRREKATWGDWFRVAGDALRAGCSPRVVSEFGKLALPGALMNACETGAYDVTTTFAGEGVDGHSVKLGAWWFCVVGCSRALGVLGVEW